MKDALFSLKTGKQAPELVEKFLLGFIDDGKKRRDDFIEKFSKSPECFEQPITKVKCLSFAAENLLKKNKPKRFKKLQTSRELVTCMVVCYSCQLHKDYILRKYSPTHCFLNRHPDCSLRLSQKSEEYNKYFKKIVMPTVEPTTVDVIIVDGMFLVRRMLPEKCPNFAVFARLLLMKRQSSKRIYALMCMYLRISKM